MSLRVRQPLLRYVMILAFTLVSSVALAEVTVQLSDGTGQSSDPQILISPQQDARILFNTNDRLFFALSALDFQATPVHPVTNAQPQGRIAISTGIETTLVFRQNGTPTGDDIMFALSSGGGFNTPFFLTTDAVVDSDPDCVNTSQGINEFVWQSLPTPSDPKIYVFRDTLFPVLVGDGEDPAVADAGGNLTFVGYLRNGDAFGRFHSGNGLLSPEVTIASIPGTITDLRIEGDNAGDLHAIFVNSGNLVYVEDSGGSFGPPVGLGPVDNAGSLSIAPDGTVTLGYTSGGVTYGRERQGVTFTPAIALSPMGTTTSHGSVARDSSGYYHAAWVEAGEVVYHNNVPEPVVEFAADVVSGEQVLDVSFTSLTSGVVDTYLWEFGDGETSTMENPTHSYALPGTYTVTLSCSGPGGEDTLTKTDYIDVDVASNILTIPHLEVFAGQDIQHPILATHPAQMEGFTVGLVYDDAFLSNVDITLSGSQTQPFNPELVLIGNFPAGANSVLIHTILMEVSRPFDGFAIDPGQNQRISNIEYTVSASAPVGTVIPFTLTDGLLTPPQDNVFAQNGISSGPLLVSGSTTVVSPPQNLFLRGDASGDDNVDIADAVAILSFLFGGQPLTGCPDGADANDSGVINIADPIAVLAYLFGGGQQLMYPSPMCGLDPTPDALTCAQNYCP